MIPIVYKINCGQIWGSDAGGGAHGGRGEQSFDRRKKSEFYG